VKKESGDFINCRFDTNSLTSLISQAKAARYKSRDLEGFDELIKDIKKHKEFLELGEERRIEIINELVKNERPEVIARKHT